MSAAASIILTGLLTAASLALAAPSAQASSDLNFFMIFRALTARY